MGQEFHPGIKDRRNKDQECKSINGFEEHCFVPREKNEDSLVNRLSVSLRAPREAIFESATFNFQ